MRRIRLFLVAATLILVSLADARAQVQGGVVGGAISVARPGMPPRDPTNRMPTGSAVLSGRVTIASSSTPLRHAQVMLFALGQQVQRTTTTDAEGRYRFTDLPAGRYSVTANKAGYLSQQYGQRRANEAGTPVPLSDGQTMNGINLAVLRGGVIAGRITDEYGEPIARATVQALRYFYSVDGQRRPQPSASSTTDDLGQFRLFGLMPGEYIVSASGVQGFMGGGPGVVDTGETYLTSYFPGSPNINDAQTVPLAAGEEATVQLALGSGRLSRVAGMVVDSAGKPVGNAMTTLTTATGSFIMGNMGGPTAADGSFSLSNVAPGDYILRVQPMMRPGDAPLSESGSLPITVGGADLLNLRITTSPGATITGRVIFEGAARRDNGPGGPFRVFAQPADQFQAGASLSLQPGLVANDGSFEIKGARGPLLLRVAVSQDWALKSVSLEGQDITDTPTDVSGRDGLSGVTIVLTDKLTDVSGRVTDSGGQVLKDYLVVLQPADQRSGTALTRYLRTVRPDQDGRFQAKGLPPGAYDATAVASLEQGRQFVPEVQARLRESARRFTLREGETLSLDLRLTAGFE